MMNQLSLSVAHSGRMLFSFISCFILSIHLSLGLPLGRDPGTFIHICINWRVRANYSVRLMHECFQNIYTCRLFSTNQSEDTLLPEDLRSASHPSSIHYSLVLMLLYYHCRYLHHHKTKITIKVRDSHDLGHTFNCKHTC